MGKAERAHSPAAEHAENISRHSSPRCVVVRRRVHEQAPPHHHRQGLKGSSHIMAVVRVAGEQRTQVEQGGRMLAKERASGACHMCQRSGCAAGAGTAHGAERLHRA